MALKPIALNGDLFFFNGDPILSEMGTHRNKDFLFEKSVSSFGAQCFHK